MDELYVVAKFDKDGKRIGYLSAGRPSTIRVYKSYESAERGLKQKASFYKRQGITPLIMQITGMLGVER